MVFLVWTLTNILDPKGGSWLNLLTISILFLRIFVMEWWLARGNENISFCNDENPAENNDVDKKDIITPSWTNIVPHRGMSRTLKGLRGAPSVIWTFDLSFLPGYALQQWLKTPEWDRHSFSMRFPPRDANQRGVKFLSGSDCEPSVFNLGCGLAMN